MHFSYVMRRFFNDRTSQIVKYLKKNARCVTVSSIQGSAHDQHEGAAVLPPSPSDTHWSLVVLLSHQGLRGDGRIIFIIPHLPDPTLNDVAALINTTCSRKESSTHDLKLHNQGGMNNIILQQ